MLFRSRRPAGALSRAAWAAAEWCGAGGRSTQGDAEDGFLPALQLLRAWEDGAAPEPPGPDPVHPLAGHMDEESPEGWKDPLNYNGVRAKPEEHRGRDQ